MLLIFVLFIVISYLLWGYISPFAIFIAFLLIVISARSVYYLNLNKVRLQFVKDASVSTEKWFRRVVLLSILLIVSYMSIRNSIFVCSSIYTDEPICLSIFGQREFLDRNILTYLFSPFSLLLHGRICNRFFLALLNLPYLYLLALIILKIYDKIKTHTHPPQSKGAV
jgi:hypothetical protein